MTAGVVIVGAGQAGLQAALSLRQDGYEGRIQMLGDEPALPYQRPPLSKAYLGDGNAERLILRPKEFLDDHRIELTVGTQVERIDRAVSCIVTPDGRPYPYDTLVLATGTRPRELSIAGRELANVLELRNLAQAGRLRAALSVASQIAIVGGGFIGLEVAAVARAMGRRVTVVEAGNRILGRSATPDTSAHLLRLHRKDGVEIRYRVGACRILGDDRDRVAGLLLADDTVVPADLVLLAAGAVPNDELARAAGLVMGNGIRVDGHLRTSDPRIYAIGDCAEFQFKGEWVRLESVQNAVDQAKCAARNIMGKTEAYDKVPWFWSDQGSNKLQIAGLTSGADHCHVRRSEDGRKFTVTCFRDKQFVGVETVNAPADHIAARSLLARSQPLMIAHFAAANFDLKAVAGATA